MTDNYCGVSELLKESLAKLESGDYKFSCFLSVSRSMCFREGNLAHALNCESWQNLGTCNSS